MNKAAWFLTSSKAETPEGPGRIIGINTEQSTSTSGGGNLHMKGRGYSSEILN